MAKEKRKKKRHVVQPGTIPGMFLIKTGSETRSFTQVRDVSVSGVGISLDQPIDSGSEITLSYREEDVDVTVTGKVAWCSKPKAEREEDLYCIGIELPASEGNENALFFMALREYIDKFE